MLQTDPNTYTDVSKEDFDRFKQAAKARGMNISGNKDDVEFDGIGVHVEYKDDKTLQFLVHEPHWLAPGVTLGALHTMVQNAMNVQRVPKGNENPVITKDHTTQADINKGDDSEVDEHKAGSHPSHVSRATHAPHAAKSAHSR
jgi:hypothetical protein